MRYNTLNQFIQNDVSNKENTIFKSIGKEVHSIEGIISEIKNADKKDRKLKDITRDISKIIDLYDSKNKIKINRKSFIDNYLLDISKYFSANKIKDYKDILDIIIHESVSYDESTWKTLYDHLNVVIESNDNDISKNVLYSLSHEALTPKNLIELFKKDANDEMIEGGVLKFESYTQEMLGVINEFIVLKGRIATKMYLDQGRKNNIEIVELLKEVNAASFVEPFTFTENDSPQYKKAPGGQFDGFLVHRDKAKLLLTTKNENTNIEGDSPFRHFITALLVKKKLDEIEQPDPALYNRRYNEWFNYYTDASKLDKTIIKMKNVMMKGYNKKYNKKIIEHVYVNELFVKNMEKAIDEAAYNNHKNVRINVKDPIKVSRDVMEILFNREYSKNTHIQITMEEAKEKLNIAKAIIKNQRELKETLIEEVYERLDSKKFREQMELDAKKDQLVKDSQFLSIKDMISYYNRNTKKALEELNILNNNISPEDSPYDIFIKQEEYKNSIPEIGIVEMERIIDLSKELNLELIYFGSVSNKKSTDEYYYDNTEKYRNKEYRYGLNIMAYANILSDSIKDQFKISSDAAIDFISNIELRTETKQDKLGYDVDIDKINNKMFISDVLYITQKHLFETGKLKNDSIDFYENLINSTNVLMENILNAYKEDKELHPDLTIEQVFNSTMKYWTKKEDENYCLYSFIDSVKDISMNKTDKIKNTSLLKVSNIQADNIISLSTEENVLSLKNKYKIESSVENKKRSSNRRKY